MKYYIFGDTGGHAEPLFNALTEIGVDILNHIIPEDVTIIHLGDLIHKGPSSDLIVSTVDSLIHKNPDRWIQILGNHEYNHIPGGVQFWNCKCSDETIATLNVWQQTGLAQPSFALKNVHTTFERNNTSVKDFLFLHGGLSQKWWEALGSPKDVNHMSDVLNQLSINELGIAGELLGMNAFAGPVWAVGSTEVFPSWTHTMPFNQMIGHTTGWLWSANKWFNAGKAHQKYNRNTKIYTKNHITITDIYGSLLIGADPGNDKRAIKQTQPYTLLEQK